MKTAGLKGLLLSALLLVGSQAPLHAQPYSIDWFKVAGGGGTSTNGQYVVNGTLGQHDAGGPLTGGSYSLTGGFWAILSTVQTQGAPVLFITQSGANAILSWSAAAAGFVLQNNADLTLLNNWSDISAAPVTTNGFNYVTNTIAPGNNFYRLRHP
jgi:hypothetical protein